MAVTQSADSPTKNYAVMTPVYPDTGTFSKGNLTAVTAGNDGDQPIGSIAFDSQDSDGYYFIMRPTTTSSSIGAFAVGVATVDHANEKPRNDATNAGSWFFNCGNGNVTNTSGIANGTWDSGGNGGISLNHYVQVAVKAGKIYFGVNNTWYDSSDGTFANAGEAFDNLTGFVVPMFQHAHASAGTVEVQFGQQGFTYAAPTGFKEITAVNLYSSSAPTIEDGSLYLQPVSYIGNGHTQDIIVGETVLSQNSDASSSGIHSGDVDDLSIFIQPTRTGPITRAGFEIFNSSGAANSGNFVNCIYTVQEDNGFNSPDGTTLTNGQVTGVSGSDGGYAFGSFPNGGPVVEAGKSYWLTLSHSSGSWACRHDVSGDDMKAGVAGLRQGTTIQMSRSTPHTVYQGIYKSATSATLQPYPISQFSADMVWIKGRSDAGESIMVNKIRGATNVLTPDSDAAEFEDTSAVTAFATNGFSLGIGGSRNDSNDIGKKYIAHNFLAGGGSTSTPSGSSGISSLTVSTNTTAGFSIGTFTAQSSGADGVVAHGLGGQAAWILLKPLATSSEGNDWTVWHIGANTTSSNGTRSNLNSTGAVGSGAARVNAAGTSTFTINDDAYFHGRNFAFFAWKAIPGYSAFGSYEGNNAADGTFVHLGFTPSWFLAKNIDATGAWLMFDTVREPFNLMDLPHEADDTKAEATSSGRELDFLSNGVKMRGNSSYLNSAHTFLYSAFAQNPFAGSTPATAR